MFPLAFVAGWLQGHWWGFISRNYVVWPTFFLMNVFIALKGSHFWFYITVGLAFSPALSALHQRWKALQRIHPDPDPERNTTKMWPEWVSHLRESNMDVILTLLKLTSVLYNGSWAAAVKSWKEESIRLEYQNTAGRPCRCRENSGLARKKYVLPGARNYFPKPGIFQN